MIKTNINIYGLIIILSLVANIVIVILTYNKKIFTKDEIIGALAYEIIGIVIGAKLLTYIENYNKIKEFNFMKLGLSSYGGIIGAIICLLIFGIQFKKRLKDMLLTFILPIPLMYSIGKIGCFLVGCCYGIEYNGIGSIVYKYSLDAPNNIHLFPVQLIESIVFLIIFIFILKKELNNKYDIKLLGITFITCGIAKFILDFFRMSHVGIIISTNQLLSIIFILIGLYILKRNNKTCSKL